MWVVEAPTRIAVSSKSEFILNLNEYRNAHHQLLNKAKVAFTKLMLDRIKHLPVMQQVNLTFTYFSGTNHLSDTSNVCSVVDKFFCDALVEGGYINDDNYTVVRDVNYRHGGVDAGQSRVEVTIEPIGDYVFPEKEEDMQITLNQLEIEQAITNLIHDQINIKEGMTIKIDLTATRGPEGFKATIDIVPAEPVAETPVVTSGKTPRTVTAKAAEVVKDTAPKTTKAAEPQAEAEPVAETQAEPVTEAEPEQTTQAVVEEPETAASEPEPETQAAANEPEAEAQAEAETVPSKPATSLFAGLNRPKNG